MAYRVIQWATGNVGTHSLRAILAHPRLELVGLRVYGAEKAGEDAGRLCGVKELGVKATTDVEQILSLDADCVVYNALGETRDPEQSLADICALLESGKNVVSTAVSTHIYPKVLPLEVLDRLEAACQVGRVSFHSTGINPGFSFDVLPITLSALANRMDRIRISELVDMSGYDSRQIVHDFIGMGQPPEAVVPMDRRTTVMGSSFHASMQLLADALNLPLDDIRLTQEKAVTDRRLQIASGTVEAGTVAARRTEYVGIVDGEPRIFYELVWRVTNDIRPEWPSGDAHYDVVIEGDPCLRCRLDISTGQGRHISMVTAMHAVNAIPYVCEAEPGVKTFLDLPLMGGGVSPSRSVRSD